MLCFFLYVRVMEKRKTENPWTMGGFCFYDLEFKAVIKFEKLEIVSNIWRPTFLKNKKNPWFIYAAYLLWRLLNLLLLWFLVFSLFTTIPEREISSSKIAFHSHPSLSLISGGSWIYYGTLYETSLCQFTFFHLLF